MIKYIIIFLLLFNSLVYSQNDIKNIKSIKDSIDKYYYSFNTKKLNEILNKCDNLLATQSKNFYLNYYKGMLHYNLCKIYFLPNEDLAIENINLAIDHFKKAYEIKRHAEVAGLLSAAYGKKSALSGMNAFVWGLKAKSWIEDAFELDKNNSKLNLIAATHLMHTPPVYGGDKKKARELLEQSLENNKNKTIIDNLLLDWAENAEVYAYLAQLEILEKNPQKAKYYFSKSLELQNNYDFVKIDLQNQLDILNSSK